MRNIKVIAPLIVMIILALLGIQNEAIILDEAETLCIGKNVAQYGYPVAWNGEYLNTTINGNDYNEELIHVRYPWFQYYLVAFVYLFANNNVLVYKLFFILVGVASAYWLYKSAYSFTQDKLSSEISLWLYSISIGVISMIRTIRYYAPSLLLVNIILYSYNEVIRKKSKKNLIMFIVASVLLFNTFHIFFVCTMLGILILYFFYDRKKIALRYVIIVASCISIMIIIPALYFIYFSFVISNDTFSTNNNSVIKNMTIALSLYNNYFIPIFLIVIIAFSLWVVNMIFLKKSFSIRDKEKRVFFLSISLAIINVLVVAILISYANGYELGYRYLLAGIPMMFVSVGILFRRVFLYDQIAAIVMVVVMTFSNVFNMAPIWVGDKITEGKLEEYYTGLAQLKEPYSLARQFCNNYLHPKPKMSIAIKNFLKRYAKDSDLVVSDLLFRDMIYFECGLVAYSNIDFDGTVSNLSRDNARSPVFYPDYQGVSVKVEDISWIVVTPDIIELGYLPYQSFVDEHFERINIVGAYYYHDFPELNSRLYKENLQKLDIQIYRNKDLTEPISKNILTYDELQ